MISHKNLQVLHLNPSSSLAFQKKKSFTSSSQTSPQSPDTLYHTHIIFRIAAAFTTVVTSFVSEILLPPLSLIPGINRNMDSKFAILRRGPNFNKTDGIGYNTLEQAAADGAVVMAYGYASPFSFHFLDFPSPPPAPHASLC